MKTYLGFNELTKVIEDCPDERTASKALIDYLPERAQAQILDRILMDANSFLAIERDCKSWYRFNDVDNLDPPLGKEKEARFKSKFRWEEEVKWNEELEMWEGDWVLRQDTSVNTPTDPQEISKSELSDSAEKAAPVGVKRILRLLTELHRRAIMLLRSVRLHIYNRTNSVTRNQ